MTHAIGKIEEPFVAEILQNHEGRLWQSSRLELF
jgi:hypothetical protein